MLYLVVLRVLSILLILVLLGHHYYQIGLLDLDCLAIQVDRVNLARQYVLDYRGIQEIPADLVIRVLQVDQYILLVLDLQGNLKHFRITLLF